MMQPSLLLSTTTGFCPGAEGTGARRNNKIVTIDGFHAGGAKAHLFFILSRAEARDN